MIARSESDKLFTVECDGCRAATAAYRTVSAEVFANFLWWGSWVKCLPEEPFWYCPLCANAHAMMVPQRPEKVHPFGLPSEPAATPSPPAEGDCSAL